MKTINKINHKTKREIEWTPRLVDIDKIKPTPNNFKIKTDLGLKRLQASLSHFGLAGTIVVNTNLVLIDGNSRVEEMRKKKLKKIWVSVPNREMTKREFEDMSALFDYAIAGEVDVDRIHKEKGVTSDFYKQYGIEMPLHIIEKVGNGQKVEWNGKEALEKKFELNDESLMQLSLFITVKQEKLFRKWEPELTAKLKGSSVTDTIFKCIEETAKRLKIK